MVKNVNPHKKRFLLIFTCLIFLIAAALFLYIYARTYAKSSRLGMEMPPEAFESILNRAIPALLAMSCAAAVIAILSLAFQTITQSRLLTPSMIGFDSVFVGTQTSLVFLFGASARIFSNPYLNYLISAGIMVVVSLLMYSSILRKSQKNIIFLLMFGLVFSGILRNGARYLQVIMSEHDFNQVQAAVNVTINNMNTNIIFLALPLMLGIMIFIISRHKTYDVMSLGADNAKSLGVDYDRQMTFALILIAIGMSAVTALIGSLTFLGLLAVNIAREILKTSKHLPLFIGSAGIAALTLIFGQGVVELIQGAVPVSAVIDLLGCSYMFYLILKENRL